MKVRIWAWSATISFLVVVIGFAWSATLFAQILAAISISCAFGLACHAYGVRHAVALLLICSAITFTIENIGVATGLPFGLYHFTIGADRPRIGVIPLVVGGLWFGMGYCSWVVAGALLDHADGRLNEKGNVIALPLVAAFVMTQWDVVMDAPSATISGAWIWHRGGAFFGVPISNFFGWFSTSWLFFQAYALYLRRQEPALDSARAQSPEFRVAAVLLYLSAGLTHLTPWLIGPGGDTVDGAGHVWRIDDIRESTVAVMLFTMLFSSTLALLRIGREHAGPANESSALCGFHLRAVAAFADEFRDQRGISRRENYGDGP
ncbi:carotenoid biosynthesis protein [Methylosinus sp. R-45379]|uniref:carotenoid biosynthesis protein n=1 Tax=Methylosinus sp. R-45379 TaxID=980563 RepID=UPI000A42EEEB|nr:carotenoid biosynthesis protein [Methylosinus sp. R-45379]